jgi:RNA polymerase-binding protein DksA
MAKVKRDLRDLEAKLLAERDELQRQMAELERQTLGVAQSEATGDVSFAVDDADSGSATFERERDFSLAANIKDILDKVEHAIDKIRDGSYGTCESCGQAIEPARMKALPYASLCITCKKREEAHR